MKVQSAAKRKNFKFEERQRLQQLENVNEEIRRIDRVSIVL